MKWLTQIALVLLITGLIVVLLLKGSPTLVRAQTQDDDLEQAAKPESTRSWPQDTTPSFREPVPEDYAPGGIEAIPPWIIIDQRSKHCGSESPYGQSPEAEKTKSNKIKEE